MPSLFNLTGKSLSTSFLHQLINYDNGIIIDYERHLQDLQQQSSVLFPAIFTCWKSIVKTLEKDVKNA